MHGRYFCVSCDPDVFEAGKYSKMLAREEEVCYVKELQFSVVDFS